MCKLRLTADITCVPYYTDDGVVSGGDAAADADAKDHPVVLKGWSTVLCADLSRAECAHGGQH
jgi:hypothetical protein